jgi:hypothetical protein
MIWFVRQSSCSAWSAFGGERRRACGCPGAREVPAILLPDWQPHVKFANHDQYNNRALLCPIRSPSAAIAVMCSSMSSLEHGRRIGQLVYRWQSGDSGNEQAGFGHDNRQLSFAAMADAIHNRNNSSRNEDRSQSQLNRNLSTPDGERRQRIFLLRSRTDNKPSSSETNADPS